MAETATGFGCSLRGSEGDGNDDAMAVAGGVLACLDIDKLSGFFCERNCVIDGSISADELSDTGRALLIICRWMAAAGRVS